MTTVSALELHRHLSEVLDEVRGGRTFEVTRNGRPVGRLVPVETRSAVLPSEVEDQ